MSFGFSLFKIKDIRVVDTGRFLKTEHKLLDPVDHPDNSILCAKMKYNFNIYTFIFPALSLWIPSRGCYMFTDIGAGACFKAGIYYNGDWKTTGDRKGFHDSFITDGINFRVYNDISVGITVAVAYWY
ncbi:MAG: hypothetical protein QXG12_06475 [Thermoproteota archaeon]